MKVVTQITIVDPPRFKKNGRLLQAPFDEDTREGVQTLFDATSDEAITRLRNEVDADLVQIITHFNDRSCGYG